MVERSIADAAEHASSVSRLSMQLESMIRRATKTLTTGGPRSMPNQSIAVTHNAEAAHRLFLTPGKCENIHGHSFKIMLELYGEVDEKGMVEGLDFGDVKREFRHMIDTNFDHRLLLNRDDPWADALYLSAEDENGQNLPGLAAMDGDPTTENIARWVGEWAVRKWNLTTEVAVQETAVNGASWTYVAAS
jgi:6-pyruvoyltetrahydropterin/6-carboxytetrahydropterin synthase